MRVTLLFLLISSGLLAQTSTLKVWPGGVPGSKTSGDYREVVVAENGRTRISKVTDPELLVYLPEGKKTKTSAIVICPGGGYGRLAIDHEGWDIAKWLNEKGIAGIVLKYRLPSAEIMIDKSIGPLQDVQEAIRIVRRNSKMWNIDPGKVGVMGFSAGGHLAASASTMYDEKVYSVKDTTSARPDFSVLMYGVLSMQKEITHGGSLENLLGPNANDEKMNKFSNELRITKDTPPAFLVHSMDDVTVPVENSIRYLQALRSNKVPAELHVYEKGGHGYGLALKGGSESLWPRAFEAWLNANGWAISGK